MKLINVNELTKLALQYNKIVLADRHVEECRVDGDENTVKELHKFFADNMNSTLKEIGKLIPNTIES